MVDLFDLVNSFIEKGYGVVDEIERIGRTDDEDEDEDFNMEVMMKDSLKGLIFGLTENNGDDDIEAITTSRRKTLLLQVEKARRHVPRDSSSSGYKLQLVAQLCRQGIDAGLCESKWEKNGRIPSGYYEYIDANINGTRYIIEISLGEEFEIARPNDYYTSLLNVFPQIVVCKVEELKKIVKIMCDGIKESMKQQQMHVPPWRRQEYVNAKWFGPYKRSTSEFPPVADNSNSSMSSKGKGQVDFCRFQIGLATEAGEK